MVLVFFPFIANEMFWSRLWWVYGNTFIYCKNTAAGEPNVFTPVSFPEMHCAQQKPIPYWMMEEETP